jgi:3-hydroxybutyryl-CoA dehydrogenase
MDVIGVVGLGAMGMGIAQVFLQAGHKVVATDAAAQARASAAGRLADALAARVARGALAPHAVDEMMGRFAIAPDPSGLAPARLVVEAVVERAEVKRAVFAALEECLDPRAVLATNTSSIRVETIARPLRHPGRLVGLHFFNPAPAMRLVELIGHAQSAPEALDLARALTEAAGKTVVRAPDRPGFIVNRCARPFYGEALALLGEGRRPAEIDAAMLTAGYRMGPFALIDLIGSDVNLAATEGLAAAMGGHPRYHVFPALRAQVECGRLGRKTGAGFVFPADPEPPPHDAAGIVLRIEATLINEAAWLLSEGGTTREGIDTAMKLGLNFPRGPFEMLAAHGAGRVRETLAALERAAPTALAGRYRIAGALAEA